MKKKTARHIVKAMLSPRFSSQEETYTDLVGKINATESRLGSVQAQNKILEDQHDRDRRAVAARERKIGELRGALEERDRLVEELQGQVGADRHQFDI